VFKFNSERIILAGRVIGLVDIDPKGFVIQDDSGKILVLSDLIPNIGDIVEVQVLVKGNELYINGQPVILVKCEADFYISKDSPNYKKLIIDLNLKEKLIKRTLIMAKIREFFVNKGFLDVDTPELVNLPGMEPYLDIFKSKFEVNFDAERSFERDMYLITSPEYAMKKLLVAGFEKIFQLTKAFRNKETFSDLHNPEFTILEWYRAYASYEEIIQDTEDLVKFLFQEFGEGKRTMNINGHEVRVLDKWKKLRVVDAFEQYAGINKDVFEDLEKFREAVKRKGYNVNNETSFDDLFFLVFLNEIEGKLGLDVPVILCDYPLSMAALSKQCANDVKYAERYEAYIGGVELCNGFTELNDASEQKKRLEAERIERINLKKAEYAVDASFIEALELGMPPSGGTALGVDRLIMLLVGAKSIEEVLFFPFKDL